MTVINLDEHRPKKVGPCRITFFSSRFGRDSAIEYNYDIENGDVEGVIKTVQQSGGVWLPSHDDSHTFWFLPWPCAAVRVTMVGG
jgi:hypothetical protein